ncbi:MAG: hypothetical protein O8C67_03625 [Candidatus Methanoperedens sp.]|nr:hypothetical protein [Candidatus Methanoperedens sp.]
MESYSKKQIEAPSASPHPSLVAEGERGLTPKRKKILEETMRRHDTAFKILANM